MVPGPVANAILHSATLHLQRSNLLFSGKALVIGKFGEELLKQANQTSSTQSNGLTAPTGTRPVSFIPGVSEGAVQAGTKNTSSKRSSKKRSAGSNGASALPGMAGKR